MGTYSLEHIIKEWAKDKMTSDQVIGQVLLLIQELRERIVDLEARMFRLEQNVDK